MAEMVKFKGIWSSVRMDWKTPKALYAELDKEFKFDFDPCPSDPLMDGLRVPWGRVNFVNPPYGKQIGDWCAKAAFEAKQGKTIVLLIPARTDTKYFHDHVIHCDELRFIKGRLQFDDCGSGAPFPSILAIWREEERLIKSRGSIVQRSLMNG